MTTQPLTGELLLKTAVNLILRNPNCWDQSAYHSYCKSKHCIAGLCQILAGFELDSVTAFRDAQKALGITNYEAYSLFRADNTLSEIYRFAENFNRSIYKSGFDRSGFDKSGFSCYGFDRNGFDIKGYNPKGFDHKGFDRKGFDFEGFDRKGFDHEGFDRRGLDSRGFDFEGFNCSTKGLRPFKLLKLILDTDRKP